MDLLTGVIVILQLVPVLLLLVGMAWAVRRRQCWLGIGFALLLALYVEVIANFIDDEQRLAMALESDLSIDLETRPSLLLSETYGWAEEGGDRALLRLCRSDCGNVATRLYGPTPANTTSTYFRLFSRQSVRLQDVVTHFWQNEKGDYRHYVLDPVSCILYREAHFE